MNRMRKEIMICDICGKELKETETIKKYYGRKPYNVCLDCSSTTVEQYFAAKEKIQEEYNKKMNELDSKYNISIMS